MVSEKFFKYEGNIVRVHDFGSGFVGLFRAGTQLSPDKMPAMEQFQVGGISSVRGFSEGLLIGNKSSFIKKTFLKI